MRYLVTISCLVAAIILYGFGAYFSASIFGIAGVLFELTFWKRIFSRSKRRMG
jgi:hypothetical protein